MLSLAKREKKHKTNTKDFGTKSHWENKETDRGPFKNVSGRAVVK